MMTDTERMRIALEQIRRCNMADVTRDYPADEIMRAKTKTLVAAAADRCVLLVQQFDRGLIQRQEVIEGCYRRIGEMTGRLRFAGWTRRYDETMTDICKAWVEILES